MVSTLLSKFSEVTYTTSSSGNVSGAGGVVFILVLLALTVFLLAAMWKVFQKAGKPGWAAIVPVYNLWVLFEIAGKPGWWALLAFVPFVNIVVVVLEIIAVVEIAKRFGKSGAWGFFLLFLLLFIGWPILGFGDAQYQAAAAPTLTPGPTPPAPTGVTPPVV